MRIAVFGLGYVGIVSAACLARDGHEVVGVDPQPEKVALVNAGKSADRREPASASSSPRRWRRAGSGRPGSAAEAVAAAEHEPRLRRHALAAQRRLDVAAIERVCEEIGAADRRQGRAATWW